MRHDEPIVGDALKIIERAGEDGISAGDLADTLEHNFFCTRQEAGVIIRRLLEHGDVRLGKALKLVSKDAA